MAGHSESTASHCRALFDIALRAYEKKTSITLAQHPLALQLRNCHSVESIASFLQDQIPSSSDSGGSNRVMASIRSTISILSNLSAASALAWANDMVCEIKTLMACSTPPTPFFKDYTAINAGVVRGCSSRGQNRRRRRDRDDLGRRVTAYNPRLLESGYGLGGSR